MKKNLDMTEGKPISLLWAFTSRSFRARISSARFLEASARAWSISSAHSQGMGEAHIVDADGQRRRAACMGGMLTVLDGEVRLVATTWEWAEQIDHTRAEAAKKRAEEILARKDLDRREYEMAQARLKRALVRTSIKD